MVSKNFSINKELQDNLSIINLDGYLDAHTAPKFEKEVQNEINNERYRIIVNCEKLNYISSAGIGVFLSFIDEIREHGGDIKICCLMSELKEILEVVNFMEVFEIIDDQAAAIESFSSGQVRRK